MLTESNNTFLATKLSIIVFASSSSVYGGALVMPTREESDKEPKSPYAWQKSAIEVSVNPMLLIAYLHLFDLKYVEEVTKT